MATASSPAPYSSTLGAPLEVRSLITITGKTDEICERFAINLACGTEDDIEPDIAFHFNPRLSLRYVVRNTRHKGQWGAEETTSYRSFPFERDKDFRVDIFVAYQLFFIQIDGKHFCSYAERLPLNKITWMNVTSSVKVENVTFSSASDYPSLEPFGETMPDVPFCEKMTNEPPPREWDPLIMARFPQGLQIGHQLIVRCRIHLLPHSFFINIQEDSRIWPRPTVMFHFNTRFAAENTKQVIVFNTRDNANWGAEERSWSSRMQPGSQVELSVCRGPRRYYCWIGPWDGADISKGTKSTSPSEGLRHTLLGSMTARTTNSSVGFLYVQGDISVSQVFTCNIPPELNEDFQEEDYVTDC